MQKMAGAAIAALLVAGASLACARQVRIESDSPQAVASDTVSGRVRQVGNAPFVRTIIEGESRSVRIVGPLEAEVAHLVGARVRAVGVVDSASAQPLGPALRASAYTILSVDGDTPVVGYLRRSEAGEYYLHAEDGSDLSLSFVSRSLAEKVGAKVWVVTNDQGAVTRYGILREP
jgi:hypothetical protein